MEIFSALDKSSFSGVIEIPFQIEKPFQSTLKSEWEIKKRSQ